MRAGRRRAAAVRVATAVGVFALSSLVVFANPETAQAVAVPPAVLELGETLAAPIELGASEGGGVLACTASLVCGGLVLAGTAAYMTKDIWLPVLKDAFGAAVSKSTGQGEQGGQCIVTSSPVLVGDNGLDMHVQFDSGCHGFNGNSEPTVLKSWVGLRNLQCKSSSNGVQYQPTPGYAPGTDEVWQKGPTEYTWTIRNACPAGSTIQYVESSAAMAGPIGETWASAWFATGVRVSDEALAQTSTMRCLKPDGTYDTVSQTATGAQARDRVVVPSCGLAFPGSIPSKLTVTGGVAGEEDPLGTVDFADTHTQYPDCFGADGAYLNTCRVRVFINGQPCVNGMAGCYDPDTWVQDHPDATKQCKWGPYAIAWSNCAPLKHHYGVTPATQTVPVIDVDPTTGKPVTDPVTKPSTGTDPSTGGETSTFPRTGTNPETPGVSPDGSTDPDSQNCFKGAWSWNPIDWVYVPVKCSLLWAFVPKTAPSFSDISSPLPAGWLPSLPDIGNASCGPVIMPQLKVGWKDWTVGPVTMLNTCDAPWPLARTFVYYGLLCTVLVTVMWQSFRAVTSGVGMGVSFSTGGDDE